MAPSDGARFRGHVKRNGRGPVYWTTCQVVTCEPGREFAFAVMGPGGMTLNTWRYRLDPAAHGTDVTESFELTPVPTIRLYWLLVGWARGRTNLAGVRTTLERMKTVAESGTQSGTGHR